MIKIVLGAKHGVNRKAMIAKGIEARDVTVYYILQNEDLAFSITTYEKIEEETDKTLEINGEYYKPIAYESPKYFTTVFNAIEGYVKMRQLKPDKDITSLKELYTELLELKKEAERLYGLIGIK